MVFKKFKRKYDNFLCGLISAVFWIGHACTSNPGSGNCSGRGLSTTFSVLCCWTIQVPLNNLWTVMILVATENSAPLPWKTPRFYMTCCSFSSHSWAGRIGPAPSPLIRALIRAMAQRRCPWCLARWCSCPGTFMAQRARPTTKWANPRLGGMRVLSLQQRCNSSSSSSSSTFLWAIPGPQLHTELTVGASVRKNVGTEYKLRTSE